MKFGKKRNSPRFELTSLIDIIFILLVFFMISSTFLKPVARISLPVSAVKETAPQQDTVVVTLTAEDKLFLDSVEVAFNDFEPIIRNKYLSNTNLIVLFYGDEALSFSSFMKVMDILKLSGINKIAISHEPE